MNIRLIVVLLPLLFAGCALTGQLPPNDSVSAAKRVPQAPASAADLLEYYQRLRGLSAAELAREQVALNQQATQPRADSWVVQQVLLQSVQRGPNDLGRSLNALDAVVKNKEPANASVKQLAGLVYGFLQEQKRLEEQTEKLNAQLRDEQKQQDALAAKQAALQDKLDGLKAIERSLLNRPQGNKP